MHSTLHDHDIESETIGSCYDFESCAQLCSKSACVSSRVQSVNIPTHPHKTRPLPQCTSVFAAIESCGSLNILKYLRKVDVEVILLDGDRRQCGIEILKSIEQIDPRSNPKAHPE